MHSFVIRRAFVIASALLGLVALARSFVIVDQTESVYVTEFGRPVRLIDRPGLHFKWPYQSARAFDRRLQLDTPPAREMLTRDKKNLEIAWYVSWRIADVEKFLRTRAHSARRRCAAGRHGRFGAGGRAGRSRSRGTGECRRSLAARPDDDFLDGARGLNRLLGSMAWRSWPCGFGG